MQKIMKLIESDSTIGFNNFQKTKINELHLAINTDNYPSRKLARKLGFKENPQDPTCFILTKENYFNKNYSNEK